MGLSCFHPIVQQWFSETLGAPTVAQEKGWAAIRERRHTLIAAPTGSGKTLAAFLTALDDLVQEGLRTPLPDEVRVVYVSPLKALSADIHKNLAEPRRGIVRLAEAAGLDAPRITAAVRTGDTTSSERAAMLRTPPHILVTTPESLYLLLTAERSREMLRTARTIIVDEIHAVIGTRRGAHLALSLERLQQVAGQPLLRIGLSATQKPIEEVGRFLVGIRNPQSAIRIVDEGHRRAMDLDLELPGSPLEAVMSHEVWEEYYNRLTALIGQHRTTLIFVNTRRMAERVARHLSDRLGDEAVTAHHGSLSKDKRLDAESRLKSGQLKALVATASLELGIDIGSVDLVCQIGSPHRIATFLQRVGRSGHTIAGMPKGRLFPVSRDDLFEGAALLRSVRRGELDRIVSHDAPLDVLAQQIAAEAACCRVRRGRVVRAGAARLALSRPLPPALRRRRRDGGGRLRHEARPPRGADSSRRGQPARPRTTRHPAPRDRIRRRDPGGRGLSSPRRSRRHVRRDAERGLRDREQRRRRLSAGQHVVAGAAGRRGCRPGRRRQGCAADHSVLDRRGAGTERRALARGQRFAGGGGGSPKGLRYERYGNDGERCTLAQPFRAAVDWLVAETGIPLSAAEQIIAYLAESRRVLGVLPTQDTLVLERFFDESGGMQLVLHAPFGSRINKAWGLALRKRFCRQFNFELQAAATEDALMLSLGPQHSFPLADVFRYLHPATARDVLVQAFLDAPVFQTRWRWNTTISLAVPRSRHGRKVPAPLQRMLADDLMAAVFPDAAACLENIPGDRVIPDHPLVSQTVRDCLEEAMDFNALAALLERIHRGDVRCVARDTPEPSPLAHEILNARPYAFLDDAPLEERRAQAVQTRRATEPGAAGDLGALDEDAIARVRDEAAPDPRDADELHDALLTAGFLTFEEAGAVPQQWFEQLTATGRAAVARAGDNRYAGWPPSVCRRCSPSTQRRRSRQRLRSRRLARTARGLAAMPFASCCAAASLSSGRRRRDRSPDRCRSTSPTPTRRCWHSNPRESFSEGSLRR